MDRISEEVRHALDREIRQLNDPRVCGTNRITRVEVTRDLLSSLGCEDRPILTVLNKCDLCENEPMPVVFGSSIRISAKTGEGIDELLRAIDENLPVRMSRLRLMIPFAHAGLVSEIRDKGSESRFRKDGRGLFAFAK